MNKNFKTRKGFTLVEAVVVSVIVAILAAVAIPLYMSYLSNTRQESVNQLAQTAAAAANNFYRKTSANPALADLNLFYDASKFTVTVSGAGGTVTVTLVSPSGFTQTVSYR
jgi:prepilin-type N-terminal cleavage/methylation domain-containing protein